MNLLQDLIQMLTTLVSRYAKQDRAVTIRDVFVAVQKTLDGEASEDGGISEPNGYVLDVYAEEGGMFAILTRSDGKLYKVPVTVDADSNVILGTETEVVMDFAPATSRQVTVKRDADGKARWFAFPACVAVLNRNGEVDSRKLFDSFVEHVERTGQYPELDFFHLGESLVLGKADWVGRDDAAYCASGTFYDTDIARAAIKSLEEEDGYWGISIAYVPTYEPETILSTDGIAVPVYNAGINRFISILPEKTAASILTDIKTNGVNMEKKIEEALKKLTGDDEALFASLAEKLDSVNRNAAGMINREGEAEVVKADPPVDRALTDADVTMIVGTEAFRNAVSEIVKQFYDEQSQSKEDAPAEKVAEPPVQEKDRDVLLAIEDLKTALADIAKTRETVAVELQNDLSARIVGKGAVVRPRATRMPSSIATAKGKPDLALIASRTLESLGAQ